eukprot:14746778-Alexandrium_andersonii.AAC.1
MKLGIAEVGIGPGALRSSSELHNGALHQLMNAANSQAVGIPRSDTCRMELGEEVHGGWP